MPVDVKKRPTYYMDRYYANHEKMLKYGMEYRKKHIKRDRAMRKRNWKKNKKLIPIRLRARSFTERLGWGKGATNKMESLLRSYLGKECEYCSEIITIMNVSLDHKIPLIRSKFRNKTYTSEELKRLNGIDNLHFTCFKCNRIKSDIPHDKFLRLLSFLNTDKDLKVLVLNRLRRSNLMWARMA